MTDDYPEFTLIQGDARRLPIDPSEVAAVVSDPPYGMNWDTDSKRFSGGKSKLINRKPGDGRSDWGRITSDDEPFDPTPWLDFPQVVLWGANHYGERLPVGTTLVWIKRNDHRFGTFLSDAEIGWMKGGHGVYCFKKVFQPHDRAYENQGKAAHPSQKPVELMAWAIRRLRLEPGSLILDPYCGSASTGVAALRLGYRFVGIEKDARWLKVAARRLKRALLPDVWATQHKPLPGQMSMFAEATP